MIVIIWWLSAQHGATMSLFGGCLHSMVQQDVTVWWLSAQHGATMSLFGDCYYLVVVCTEWCNNMT